LLRLIALFASLAVCMSTAFGAEIYPRQPVRIVDPYPPSSTSDLAARVIANQLTHQMNVQFLVENRAGAGGTIANAYVAKAPPNGYTLLFNDSSLTSSAGLYKALPYDAIRDFTPITQIVRSPQTLVVSASLPVTTLKEFIAFARANAGQLNYGSSGVGTLGHLGAELFNKTANVNIAHVPYKGGAEVATALIAGQVQVVLTGIPLMLPHIKSAKLRALAVTTQGSRAQALPDVPSFSEAGLPGIEYANWFGLAGPAGLPSAIVAILHAEVRKVLAVPAVREQFFAQGAEIVGNDPATFAKLIRDDVRLWADVVKSAGITAQ
jgi:tripartite-type tricarboxylate transporter receptor subunit TctC